MHSSQGSWRRSFLADWFEYEGYTSIRLEDTMPRRFLGAQDGPHFQRLSNPHTTKRVSLMILISAFSLLTTSYTNLDGRWLWSPFEL